MDRNLAKTLGAEVTVALQEVADRHGLHVKYLGGQFDNSTFKPKVEFLTATAEKDTFALYAPSFGLTADDFGGEFKSQGRTFKICGVAPRSYVRPILAEEVATGRKFKFPVEAVVTALKVGV